MIFSLYDFLPAFLYFLLSLRPFSTQKLNALQNIFRTKNRTFLFFLKLYHTLISHPLPILFLFFSPPCVVQCIISEFSPMTFFRSKKKNKKKIGHPLDTQAIAHGISICRKLSESIYSFWIWHILL